MKFSSVFAAAALALGAAAKPLEAFAEGGNLPSYRIAYGSEQQAVFPRGDETLEKRAKKSSSTSAAASSTATASASSTLAATDASCTNGPTSRNCWSPGYSVDTDFDQKWPTTGVTRYVSHIFDAHVYTQTNRSPVHPHSLQHYLQP